MSDLISRQAAIASAISGMVRTIQTSEGDENWIRVKEVRESLMGLPTIDAVPVKYGKWVDVMTEEWCTFDECKCSVCGVVEYFNKGWKKFSYCPHCGARMERGEE